MSLLQYTCTHRHTEQTHTERSVLQMNKKREQTTEQKNRDFKSEATNAQNKMPRFTGNLGQARWDPVSWASGRRPWWGSGKEDAVQHAGDGLASWPSIPFPGRDPQKTLQVCARKHWGVCYHAMIEGSNTPRPAAGPSLGKSVSGENSENGLLSTSENYSVSATCTNMNQSPKQFCLKKS